VGGAALAYVGSLITADSDDDPAIIFSQAMREPLIQILENAGMEMGMQATIEEMGYVEDKTFRVCNVLTNEIVEWYSGGIMDPTKVTLSAFENALSVAQLLMTLGGLIVVEQDEGEKQVKSMQEGLLKAVSEGAIG